MDLAVLLELVEAPNTAHNDLTYARAALAALRTGLPEVTSFAFELGGPEPRSAAADVPVARGARSRELTAPLDVRGVRGVVRLVTTHRREPGLGDLAAIARVASAALHHLGTLARVAGVARLAHERTRALDEHVRELAPTALVATSPAMLRLVRELLPAVAARDSSVLIRGETGTGKELIARRVHELSPRARGAFVRVNCGAIPAGLVESTLFGHERGAFTGAVRAARGLFERAHRGTLFLDEIGELPLAAQVKLLRVLETGEVERVGAERSVRVDARIVAATHRDLTAMVHAGAFRADLFYRLDVVQLRLPPLRERGDEIEALARHLLAVVARRLGRPAPTLGRDVAKRLRAHPWPGNVRELANVLERSLLFSPPGRLELDLPSPHAAPASVPSFEAASRASIEAALAKSAGRVYGPSGAAALLGLKPTTLASKMQKLGIARR